MSGAYNFGNAFQFPGLGTEVTEIQAPTGQNWGKFNPLQYLPIQIDGAARDAGNTSNPEVLRPGLLLGRVASTGQMKQWSPTATDGTHKIAAVLPIALTMQNLNTDTDRFIGAIVGGSITARGICIASSSSYGIDGNDDEYNIRAQMAPGFVFDDDPLGYLTGKNGGIMIIAADATLSELHNGTHVVVRGAVGAVNLTLPATPKRGLRYRVTNASDQNLTLTAGTADTMVTLNDLNADSVSLSTTSEKIGGTFEVIGDGTGWIVIPSLWEAQTVTVVTA